MNTKLTLKGKTKGMGWLPDYPDFRDYTLEHKAIKPMADAMRVASPAKKGNVELRSMWIRGSGALLSRIKRISVRVLQMQVWV
jgi:hypothetical protein